MNCPGHCLIYKSMARARQGRGRPPHLPSSHLPLRLAEFGVCHRDELSGALCGLRRVRRFCQDDAHIFCLPSQVASEVAANLQFIDDVYSLKLGLEYDLVLSSRPEKYIG